MTIRLKTIPALVGIVCLALPVAAAAQSAGSSGMGSYQAGYGGSRYTTARPQTGSTRDENGNRLIVDGIIQTGAGASAYARSDAYGVGGVGGGGGILGGGTAIGNNLVVITQGSWNTVIIDSTQINNGDVSADVDLNGTVDLDDDDGNP